MTVYVDLKTIKKNKNIAKMWSMFDFKIPQKTKGYDDVYLSSKQQVEYNCQEETSNILAYSSFSENMGYGNVVYTNNTNYKNDTPIAPDTIMENIFKIACNKK